jgi:hypothetical protein
MTGTVSNHSGHRIRRAYPTPAVTPVARAIRKALAVSALAVSLAAPNAPSFAAQCRADFTAQVVACPSAAEFALQHDPAVVSGGPVPMSVHAANGVHDASEISAADKSSYFVPGPITTSGVTDIVHGGVTDVVSVAGDAIALGYSDDEVSILNTGSIGAHGFLAAIGIDASGTNVRVDNDGTIFAEAGNDIGYAPAVGVRVFADAAQVHNNADGDITAHAYANGGWARARSIYAIGFSQGVVVDNAGDLDAYARADDGRAETHGIYAFGYGGPTTVHNAGDIDSHAVSFGSGAYATGINAIGYGSGANVSAVDNAGSIAALAEGNSAYAFGIFNLTRQRYGSATLDNIGTIDAQAVGNYATAMGATNLALRYGDATTTNSGDITVVGDGVFGGSATGIYNHAYVYDASVDNSGTVDVAATGDMSIAVGIYNAAGFYGDTTTSNSGSISVLAEGGSFFARAVGMTGLSSGSVDLVNYGNIDVTASVVDGPALAAGLYGVGSLAITARNFGDVSASAHSGNGDASAYGALIYGGAAGIGLLINGGDIQADASATDGLAYAIGAVVVADVASVFNDGSASAVATSVDGDALAKAAWSYGTYTATYNYGALLASAQADGGNATAHGAESIGYMGATVYNAGDIQVGATATGGIATAMGTYNLATIYGATTTNVADITAVAFGDSAIVNGVLNVAQYVGDAITTNSGDILASAVGGIAPQGEAEAIAFGVYNLAMIYDSIVDNSGSIFASATATADISGTYGFLQAKAIGAAALNAYGYWDAGIVNYGEIGASAVTSQGYALAWGAAVQSSGRYGGDVWIGNEGLLTSYAHADIGVAIAIGAYAFDVGGDATVVNRGDIVTMARAERGIVNVVTDYAYATGVQAVSFYGNTDVANYGNIEAHAEGWGAIVGARGIRASGLNTSVVNAEGGTITATGAVDVFGGGFATGIEAYGIYGVDVTNDGDIVAHGSAHGLQEGIYTFVSASGAFGIYANASFMGDVAVTNNGDITATAVSSDSVTAQNASAGATGIFTYGKYDATVTNHGDVFASAISDLGLAGAYGVVAKGKYSANIVNDASIVAIAQVGTLASDAYGANAVAMGSKIFGSDYSYAANDGSIVAQATVTADGAFTFPSTALAMGSSIGAYSHSVTGNIVNRGDIQAVARADFGYATAYGTYIRSLYDSSTSNDGDVLAVANATNGDAFAVGSHNYSLHQTYHVQCDNYGCDWANAYFVTDGGASALDNTGTITALANADGGIARSYGASSIGAFSARLANDGQIVAVTDADEAHATGALVSSLYGDALLTNSGTILAAAYGSDAAAIAVSLESGGTNTLTNTGTIAALGDGSRIAIASSGGAVANLANFGAISGAITTGNLDDSFVNSLGANWHAVGSSDFGVGGDIVSNAGTIFLDHAIVNLGVAGEGDAFANTGTLAVAGDGVLTLGGTLSNDGVLTFLNDDASDTLRVTGDFAGQGVIGFDVDGANQSGDWLRIDGNVDASSVQTLDVNFTGLPTSTTFLVPLVNVSGDATAGNFTLGDVWYQGGLLTLDFSLAADVDVSNARDDVFSLGVQVTGLSNAGSSAVAVAPGVQSLVDAQVGSFRQRNGALPPPDGSHLSTWARGFADHGGIDPQHSANFGAGGEFAFDQSNQGWELGLEARPTDHIGIGVLVANTDGDQRLENQAGSNRFSGRTAGVFGTWRGDNGLYVDVSQRWTSVDARLGAALGNVEMKANASAFNVEAGFAAWSLAGFRILPQLQYTHTRIDGIKPVQIGAASFVDNGGVSSRARLGVAFDKTVQAGSVELTPYGSLNVVREFAGDYDHAINGGLLGTTSTRGTGALVELGLDARWKGWTFTGSVNRADGGALNDVVGSQFTARFSW